MIKRKKRGYSVVVQCLQGKRSTVLALSRTLCSAAPVPPHSRRHPVRRTCVTVLGVKVHFVARINIRAQPSR